MALTTIKVPTELRDRISADAKKRGLTAAALLAELLDEHERIQRFEAVREAYARLAEDDDYRAETRAWDATSADGLPDA